MITAFLIIIGIIALIRWIRTERKYKEAQIKAMDIMAPGRLPNDTTRTIHIKKKDRLCRVQWMGDSKWRYWVEDRPEGHVPQTYEYDHQKHDGVDYLIIVEDS